MSTECTITSVIENFEYERNSGRFFVTCFVLRSAGMRPCLWLGKHEDDVESDLSDPSDSPRRPPSVELPSADSSVGHCGSRATQQSDDLSNVPSPVTTSSVACSQSQAPEHSSDNIRSDTEPSDADENDKSQTDAGDVDVDQDQVPENPAAYAAWLAESATHDSTAEMFMSVPEGLDVSQARVAH